MRTRSHLYLAVGCLTGLAAGCLKAPTTTSRIPAGPVVVSPLPEDNSPIQLNLIEPFQMRQGETKEVTVSIKRAAGVDDEVLVSVTPYNTGSPYAGQVDTGGMTVEGSQPFKISGDQNSATVTFKTAPNAEVKKYTWRVSLSRGPGRPGPTRTVAATVTKAEGDASAPAPANDEDKEE